MGNVLRKLFTGVISSANEEDRAFDLGNGVKLSSSGQMSVSIEDVIKTDGYQNDLQVLKRIAAAHRRTTSAS